MERLHRNLQLDTLIEQIAVTDMANTPIMDQGGWFQTNVINLSRRPWPRQATQGLAWQLRPDFHCVSAA